ncbi:hypothetical protein JST97_08670 [bacterium]|nr:hypothetical protein [bacterium]
MRTLSPLLAVLMAVSLWSWTRSQHSPRLIPTRANAAVHGIHLGDTESQVVLGVGKPDQVRPILTKARPQRNVWTWSKPHRPPDLSVTFENERVSAVTGTSLTVGSKDYGLEAVARTEAAAWLGEPTSSEPVHVQDEWTGTATTWKFPELSVQMLCREGFVSCVSIEENR